MRASKSFLVVKDTLKFYELKVSSNLTPGQLSYFCLKLVFTKEVYSLANVRDAANSDP